MQEINLKVEGMKCGGCEKRVINAVLAIEGVKSVEASFAQKTVKITADSKVNAEEVAETIDNLGFEVVETE